MRQVLEPIDGLFPSPPCAEVNTKQKTDDPAVTSTLKQGTEETSNLIGFVLRDAIEGSYSGI